MRPGEPFDPRSEVCGFHPWDYVRCCPELSGGQRLLFHFLLGLASTTGKCFCSADYASENLGRCLRQIKYDFVVLQAAGLIRNIRKGPRGRRASDWTFPFHVLYRPAVDASQVDVEVVFKVQPLAPLRAPEPEALRCKIRPFKVQVSTCNGATDCTPIREPEESEGKPGNDSSSSKVVSLLDGGKKQQAERSGASADAQPNSQDDSGAASAPGLLPAAAAKISFPNQADDDEEKTLPVEAEKQQPKTYAELQGELIVLIQETTRERPDTKLVQDITEALEIRRVPLADYLADIRPRLQRLNKARNNGKCQAFFLHHAQVFGTNEHRPASIPQAASADWVMAEMAKCCDSCYGTGELEGGGYCTCQMGKDLARAMRKAKKAAAPRMATAEATAAPSASGGLD